MNQIHSSSSDKIVQIERNKWEKQSFASSCFHYFKVFFIFNYILLLAPFRFTNRKGLYYIYTNKIQKVISLVITSLVAALSVFAIRQSYVYKIKNDPQVLFLIAFVITNSAYCFVTMYTYWFKRNIFEKILNLCQNDDKTSVPSSRNTIIATILCFVVIALNLSNKLKAIFFPLNATFWDYLKSQTSTYLYCLFVTKNITIIKDNEMNLPLTMFGSFFLAFEVYWQLANKLAILFCAFSAISIFLISKEFTTLLQSLPPTREGNILDDASKVEKIANYFFYASELVNYINDVCGPILIVLLLEAVPFLSFNFIIFFDSDDYIIRANVIYHITFYMAVLLIAAEGNSKMGQLKSWLFEWCRSVDNDKESFKLLFLFSEISEANVGFKGCGFFTVTYEFVGAMISIFVTYLIILAQFQPTK